ncbi:hypothetical protein PoHVEF18_009721 [Penicillium ochrochloron]
MNYDRHGRVNFCIDFLQSLSTPPVSTATHTLFLKPSLLKVPYPEDVQCRNFLIGFDCTEVTTEAKPEFQLPAKAWIITEKLEVSLFINRLDIDSGLKPGFAAGKFVCYLKDDDTKGPAFMRIYYQIPTSGTEWSPSKDRAAQAVPPIEPTELTAFQSLMKQACPVVPRFLGYQEGKQPDDGITPGGFASTIVWEKVPGVSLSQEFFWNLDKNQRDDIRSEFRRVYE